MKKYLIALACLSSVFSLLAADASAGASGLLLRDDDVVAFCGDSITRSGHFPQFIEVYQWVCGPPLKNLTFPNFGKGGENAWHLVKQIDNEVMLAKPTVVMICYGMNDSRSARLITPKKAENWAGDIMASIDKFRTHGVERIVLSSPGCVDSTHFTIRQKGPVVASTTESTQTNLATLRDTAKALVEKDGKLVFADVHTPMVEVMAKAKALYGEDFAFAGGAGDGVHPGRAGHLVMAWAMLKALGYDGQIGTITLDLGADGKATATEGHKIITWADNSVEVESTRYPFCFLPAPREPENTKSAQDTRTVSNLFSFNEDLNRLTLVVRGAKGRQKVAWGDQSLEFDAAELEKGVNLAALFVDNPFCEPFERILTAIEERNARTLWIKRHPDADPTHQKKRLEQALERMQITPVRHKLTITSVAAGS